MRIVANIVRWTHETCLARDRACLEAPGRQEDTDAYENPTHEGSHCCTPIDCAER